MSTFKRNDVVKWEGILWRYLHRDSEGHFCEKLEWNNMTPGVNPGALGTLVSNCLRGHPLGG